MDRKQLSIIIRIEQRGVGWLVGGTISLHWRMTLETNFSTSQKQCG